MADELGARARARADFQSSPDLPYSVAVLCARQCRTHCPRWRHTNHVNGRRRSYLELFGATNDRKCDVEESIQFSELHERIDVLDVRRNLDQWRTRQFFGQLSSRDMGYHRLGKYLGIGSRPDWTRHRLSGHLQRASLLPRSSPAPLQERASGAKWATTWRDSEQSK